LYLLEYIHNSFFLYAQRKNNIPCFLLKDIVLG
jgi:hypothetical protein